MTRVLERVRALLAVALRDVERTATCGWVARVGTYDEWVADEPNARVKHDPSIAVVHLDDDDYHLSFAVRSASDAEMLVGIASVLQDVVTDEVHRAWPTCPHHDHPLDPVVLHAMAVWACPTAGFIARIGDLGD
jgi:hypothetical protein